MKTPANELECAFAAAQRGPEGTPALFRQLRQSTLAFLMVYHPELDGGLLTLAGGDRIAFKVWENAGRSFIPIFTSVERAQEALKNVGAPDNTYSLAEVLGEYLFMALASQELEVVINPATGSGELYLPRQTIRGLADGSILRPVAPRPGVYGTIRAVAPPDYPTAFLEPLSRFFRGRPEVRAAWFCRQLDAPDPSKVAHAFALQVTGGPDIAQRLEHDFTIVAKQLCPADEEFGVMMLDPAEPAMAGFMAKFPPFYSAPAGPEQPTPGDN